ncbi:MAG: PAS domain-containing protein, partial [Deltaproteobacteria bacterium]|nr:PAS domain-containing protein [Deltaproteobacteria bacterium]
MTGDRFEYANGALLKFCGRQILGVGWRDVFSERDHATMAGAIAAAISGQTRRHAVHCIKGGTTVVVEVSLSPT